MKLIKKIARALLKPGGNPNALYRFIFYNTAFSHKRAFIQQNLKPSEVVLDIGCRELPYTKDMDVRELIGIDLLTESGGVLGWTDQILAALRRRNVSLYFANAEELPFPDQSIDRITMIEVIEHIENDEKAIYEMSRVLRPGGSLYFTTPNREVVPVNNPYHLRHYSPEELTELLGKYFDKVTVTTHFPWIGLHEKQFKGNFFSRFFFIQVNRVYEALIGRFFKKRGYSLFVHCVKGPLQTEVEPPDVPVPVVCPVCKGGLSPENGKLECEKCRVIYSYFQELPVLLTHIPQHQSHKE